MSDTFHILGDWGSSRLRLALVDEGRVKDRREGPGALDVRGRHRAVLEALISEWDAAHGEAPVTLCGAVGAREGWTQAPYRACPVPVFDIAHAMQPAIDFARARIAPGLSWRGEDGACDVMRGEETQILGALLIEPALQRGRHYLCLPGTHTKWAVIDNGSVTRFRTVPTGEAFALLTRHTNFAGDDDGVVQDAPDAFDTGLKSALRAESANPLALAFQARALRLLDQRDPTWARGFISGALIGCDVRFGLEFIGADSDRIIFIGAPALNARFASALEAFAKPFHLIDGAAASEAGLLHLAEARRDR